MTSWSRLKGFARSKAICRRVSLTRLFTAEGGIPPSKEIFVERSSSSRITTLIKFVAGKTDYSSCINVFLFFKKSHDTSFIEILGENLSARCFIVSSKSRIFVENFRIENVGRSKISNIIDEEYFNPVLWQLCHV